MRLPVFLAACLLVVATATGAAGQSPAGACHPASPTGRVVVETTTGISIRGTLLCLSADEVLLAQNGTIAATKLSAVKWIRTRPDPVWDGALKGGVVPLVLWAVFCHGCDAAPMLRAVGGYALIGLTLDSLERNTMTIYAKRDGGPSPSVATPARPRASINWRIGF
jgi:hypothetical protein